MRRSFATALSFMTAVVLALPISGVQSNDELQGPARREVMARIGLLSSQMDRHLTAAGDFMESARLGDIDRMIELTSPKSIKKRGEDAVRDLYRQEVIPLLERCAPNTEQVANSGGARFAPWDVLTECIVDGVSEGLVRVTLVDQGEAGVFVTKFKFRADAQLPAGDHYYRRTRTVRTNR